MPLSLIGYRGTGKTTVARVLAHKLAWEWVDADVEIELRAGKSIKAIFEDDGEASFRELESMVAQDLCRQDHVVVAFGGGVVLRESNRQQLRESGLVVWLTATPETLAARIAADESTAARRPNLTSQGGITEIIAMLDKRTPLYRDCASLVVDTENKTADEVADEILMSLGNPLDTNRGLDPGRSD